MKTKELDRYRVASLFFIFSEFRAYFRCSLLGRILFCRVTDFRVIFSLDWAWLKFTAILACRGHRSWVLAVCNVSTDGADADGDVVGMLRGCTGEKMLRITFITGEVMYAAAVHAQVDKKINWI